MDKKVGRNEPCPCGSGKKYKHCCLKLRGKRGGGREEPRGPAVQPTSYAGPDGGYAPAIRIRRSDADDATRRARTVIKPSKRYEARSLARACAERDLAAAGGAEANRFTDAGIQRVISRAGYVPDREADLSDWPARLEDLKQADGEEGRPRCGLCGNTINLTKTPCCDNWICDDEASYTLFSYGRNCCYRNHRRYTVCGTHHAEGHEGHWKDCGECREFFHETELYVHFGTNEFNFETLDDPPDYEPTRCSECGRIIKLGLEGYMMSGDDYTCGGCADTPFG